VGSCYLMKETPSSLDSGSVLVNVVCYARGAPHPHAGFPSHASTCSFPISTCTSLRQRSSTVARESSAAGVFPRHSAS
jgi:hypothetical protein